MTTTPINDTSIASGFNVDELTEGSLTGKGVLDVLLQTLRLHLDREFTSGRITGTAYATVYAQAITAFLAQAAQYALSKAKLPLELQLLEKQITLTQKQQDQITASIRQTDYVTDFQLPAEVANLTKAGLNTEAQTTNIAQTTANLVKQGNLLDSQKTVTDKQALQVEAETTQIAYKTTYVMPEEVEILKRNQTQITSQIAEIDYRTDTLLPSQTAQTTAQTSEITYRVANLLPAQVANQTKQTALLEYDLASIKPQELALLQQQQAKLNYETEEIIQRVEVVVPNQMAQITSERLRIDQIRANLVLESTNISKQGSLIDSQKESTDAQIAQVSYTTSSVLPAQVLLTNAQKESAAAQTALYAQKTTTELAQTTTTPESGSVMGVQNLLMNRQAENYLRDAEQKAAKLMLETWNVRFSTASDSTDNDYVNHLSEADIGKVVEKLFDGLDLVPAPLVPAP